VLCQFVVRDKGRGIESGITTVMAADFVNGTVNAAVLMLPEGRGSAIGLEAFALTVNYAFRTWPFRKVYSDVLEESFEQFGSGEGKFFEVEGCRKQHEFAAGRYQDLYTLAIYRDDWLQADDRTRKRLGLTPL